MSQGSDVVVARDVTKSFATATGTFVALDRVSLTVPDHKFVSIVGPSGCGKSTLMQIIGGLTAATTGEVTVDGLRITEPRPDQVGIVFQDPLLLPWKSARDNVEFPLALRGEPKEKRRARARELLAMVGLSDFADSFPHQLSGGMRQRVAIARGLVRHPRLLLMDEPFAALDEQTRMTMGDELLRIWAATGKTVMFVTHSLTEAVYLADEVLVMSARPGRIVDHLTISLPRPRTYEMLSGDTFGTLRDRIWRHIRKSA
ncbi:MAG TPA: ABC transporter ATP-binding protein [Steroidobacteraceae bacterium]